MNMNTNMKQLQKFIVFMFMNIVLIGYDFYAVCFGKITSYDDEGYRLLIIELVLYLSVFHTDEVLRLVAKKFDIKGWGE